MTSRIEPPKDAIAFAERLMALLDDAAFSATYKYAVLLGLIDVCLQRTSSTGEPPASITTRELAESVVERYWGHTLPYGKGADLRVLQQNSGGQAKIISAILDLRACHASDPMAPMARIRLSDPSGWVRMVREVEVTLIKEPLPRLQTIGRRNDPIIYRINWGLAVSEREVRRYQRAERSDFDNTIRLLPGVPHYLVQLNGLLRPLILRSWTAMVARLNKLPESKLEWFLFGREREALAILQRPLQEHQEGRCFYCGGRMESEIDIDHFIPWSRYPDNDLGNLVAADRRCNAAKRDHLASPRHIARWRERLADPVLMQIVTAVRWPAERGSLEGVARALYLRLPEGTPLWDLGPDFVPTKLTVLRTLFS